jgi:catechol 2,3-dioxygenase-like lactoylglutathione lyase family enzyme
MTVRLVTLAVDAQAPHELAHFWARALRWDLREADGDVVDVLPTDATTFRLQFRPSSNEKVGKNPIHFDLTTTTLDDQRDTVAELLAIGARHIDIGQGHDDTHVVLADPDGNELCIIEPGNRFLAGCPRLGAVNCDGTHALGRFYRDSLGWPLVWDQDEETAIQAPDGTGPKITWSGPPLLPKSTRERFHFHVAPAGATVAAALEHLRALGATPRDAGHACPGAVALSDVDGNELCLVDGEPDLAVPAPRPG